MMTGWPPLLLLVPLGGHNSFAADAPRRGISTVAPVRPAETTPAGSPAAGRIAENGDSSPARTRAGKFGNRVLAEPDQFGLKRLRRMYPDRPSHTCTRSLTQNSALLFTCHQYVYTYRWQSQIGGEEREVQHHVKRKVSQQGHRSICGEGLVLVFNRLL